VAYPRSSRVHSLALLLATAGAILTGCATVKPHEKELLADPAMVYGSGGAATHQEEHVVDNRTGGSSPSTSGGGCGCN
jgi:hypothetical protein